MKLIPLTQGQFSMVDDEDYEKISSFKWNADKVHGIWYATRLEQKNLKRIKFKMHRFIMGITDRKVIIDHIDRNGLNNQKSNLRIATISQNNSNRKSGKNSTSKYLGVCLCRQTNKWRCTMTHNKKQISMGIFSSEIEAAIAYDLKAKDLKGEFANLNFKD